MRHATVKGTHLTWVSLDDIGENYQIMETMLFRISVGNEFSFT